MEAGFVELTEVEDDDEATMMYSQIIWIIHFSEPAFSDKIPY
jgi:hypothetical protein